MKPRMSKVCLKTIDNNLKTFSYMSMLMNDVLVNGKAQLY